MEGKFNEIQVRRIASQPGMASLKGKSVSKPILNSDIGA
jgi:hypothetical protein